MAEYIVKVDPLVPDMFIQLEEPLLRCRDCRHFVESTCECREFSHQEKSPIDGEYYECNAAVEPDGYCAWGEPKEA